ncbi:MAG: hypothetical protein BMS9Abin15_0244 [Gammaproteobacteria bacterium]|nr:MAG: hypothetical protein BMS9Abin15_0244 [Gammaproteobacteria bacterium]
MARIVPDNPFAFPPSMEVDGGDRATQEAKAEGCAAIFDDYKPLKMKERENRAFLFPYSEYS